MHSVPLPATHVPQRTPQRKRKRCLRPIEADGCASCRSGAPLLNFTLGGKFTSNLCSSANPSTQGRRTGLRKPKSPFTNDTAQFFIDLKSFTAKRDNCTPCSLSQRPSVYQMVTMSGGLVSHDPHSMPEAVSGAEDIALIPVSGIIRNDSCPMPTSSEDIFTRSPGSTNVNACLLISAMFQSNYLEPK